ncbi:MAG: rhodanese-like domain-containing protein [Pseudomonadota bacterium]|nr:rhodanese-like domain-containing protein [Pseudomonadota bacterium]
MNDRVELPQAREVCPTTTRRLLAEGALLVDVREHTEVAQLAFDVPGVVEMPLSELEQRFAELPRDRELVLACQTGPRSLKAIYFLMYQGYAKVSNMEGGLFKWASKGFPIKGAQSAPAPAPAAPAGGCAATAASSACCDSSAAPVAGGGCCSPVPGTTGKCC